MIREVILAFLAGERKHEPFPLLCTESGYAGAASVAGVRSSSAT